MAAYGSWAQAVIRCDSCEKPVQQFCNCCQVKLCVECVTIHVNEISCMSHDIVHFRNRKVKLDFTECELHGGPRCQAHYQQSHTSICICPNKHHNVVDAEEFFKRKKEKIQRETNEIENEIIPHCKETYAYLRDDLSRIKAEFNEIEEEKEMLRNIWHQEVDYLFGELGSLFAEAKKRNSETVKQYQIKIKKQIQNMTQTLHRNKDILKTKNASDIADYNSKLDHFRHIDTRIDFKKPILKANTFKGEKLSIEVGKIQATLTFSPLSSPSTDASDRTNQTQINRAPGRPVQHRTPMIRLHDEEFRLRRDEAQRRYRRRELQRHTEIDDCFSCSD